jgi:hypothetical protein
VLRQGTRDPDGCARRGQRWVTSRSSWLFFLVFFLCSRFDILSCSPFIALDFLPFTMDREGRETHVTSSTLNLSYFSFYFLFFMLWDLSMFVHRSWKLIAEWNVQFYYQPPFSFVFWQKYTPILECVCFILDIPRHVYLTMIYIFFSQWFTYAALMHVSWVMKIFSYARAHRCSSIYWRQQTWVWEVCGCT